MDIYKKNYQFSGEEGNLIHYDFKLNEKVSFNIDIDLSDINSGELINVNIKIPGTSFSSPYEIPYENYKLEFIYNGIKYIADNMFMTEWKEVYPYSYNLKFKSINIKPEIDKLADINKIEFLIPNFIIGYDEMIIRDGIINKTDLKLSYKNQEYNITLEANPEFNNKDNANLKIKNNITSKMIFYPGEKKQIEEIYKLSNILIELIGLAYGSFRPYLVANFYNNEELKGQSLFSRDNNNSNKVLSLIPHQYSKILSEFINMTFTNYVNMNDTEKKYILQFSDILFHSISKINLYDSFKALERLYLLENINSPLEQNDEYTNGDYKLFYQEVNKFHKILLLKLGYKGKYINWSNLIPSIEDI